MSTSVNKVTLMGRLGQDPAIRYTAGGARVANLSLATDESWKDKKTGEKQKRTEWHKLVSWISIEFISQHLHKGDMVYVEGKLQTRKWTDKENVERDVTVINVTDIKPVITARSDDAPQSTNKPAAQGAKSATHRPAQQRQAEPEPTEVSDEDIPF